MIEIDFDSKDVIIEKNCKFCLHGKVCLYREEHRKMAQSNTMYGMFEYLEWNNLQNKFESDIKCQYYLCEIPKGEVNKESDTRIVEKILTSELRKFDLASWTIPRKGDETVKANIRELPNTSYEEREFKLDDLLSGYTII